MQSLLRRTTDFLKPSSSSANLTSKTTSSTTSAHTSSSSSSPQRPSESDQNLPRQPYIFPKVDPSSDGADCLSDCTSCTTTYPSKFSIDETDDLYGRVQGWATHLIVATGKSDWVRDVAEEPRSVMEAIGKWYKAGNELKRLAGRCMVSAANIPVPEGLPERVMDRESDRDTKTEMEQAKERETDGTEVLVLPQWEIVENVKPSGVGHFLDEYVDQTVSTTDPVSDRELTSLFPTRRCPHRFLILLCSQKTRDARCGQSAPLLRREFERHLRPLGLFRDLHDSRPGGVGIYFISHVGGHKYSANVLVYRRAGSASLAMAGDTGEEQAEEGRAGGENVDDVALRVLGNDHDAETSAQNESAERGPSQSPKAPQRKLKEPTPSRRGVAKAEAKEAIQCIWLARVRPEDCEGIIKHTVLKGKLVKPERQLRGGFDRCKGLVSW